MSMLLLSHLFLVFSMGKSFQNFKDLFKEWCEVTTCAGVVDLHLARTLYGKAFWTVLLLIFLGLTIFQTTTQILQFSIDTPFQKTLTIKSDAITFPNITLCNVNRINVKLLGEFENDTDMLSYALIPANLYNLVQYDPSSANSDINEERWRKFKEYSQISDIRDMFRKFGSFCEDAFMSCKWDKKNFSCCAYASEVMSNYGRCWTLQPPPDDQYNSALQKERGSYFGLQIILNSNLHQYVRNLVVNNFLEEGFFLDIGYVQESYISNFKALQPGTHSWIGMKATKQTIKLSQPQIFNPKCQNFRKFNYIEAEYTPSNCMEDCKIELHYIFCNCTHFTKLILPQFMICTPQQMLNCVYPLYDWIFFSTKIFNEKYKKCRNSCIQSCDPYWSIESSQTSTKCIGDHVSQKMGEILNGIYVNVTSSVKMMHNAICLNVFFDTLDYVEVQLAEANPIFEFIGNIGGQLSLWLGISFATLIQAWYYMVACCCSKNVEKQNMAVNKSKM